MTQAIDLAKGGAFYTYWASSSSGESSSQHLPPGWKRRGTNPNREPSECKVAYDASPNIDPGFCLFFTHTLPMPLHTQSVPKHEFLMGEEDCEGGCRERWQLISCFTTCHFSAKPLQWFGPLRKYSLLHNIVTTSFFAECVTHTPHNMVSKVSCTFPLMEDVLVGITEWEL